MELRHLRYFLAVGETLNFTRRLLPEASVGVGGEGRNLNDVFISNQPQYPDLQGHFDIDSKGLQAVSDTTRHLPDLAQHLHPAYSGY